MRAIVQHELGGPEVLQLADVPRPEPGIGEILIRVEAAGINPVDAMKRSSGAFGAAPPFTLGWDVAGTVAAVGPGVTLWMPGDAVFGMLPFPRSNGTYAEFAIAPARAVIARPEEWDAVHAAALPMAGLTAWQSLVDTARLSSGSRVLITAAAGGVGHLAVQVARARGAHVIALASPQNADLVSSLGAHEVIDYRATPFESVVRDVDVVFELVGGDYPARALTTLRPGGALVSTLPQSLSGIRDAAAAAGLRVAGMFVESDPVGLAALVALARTGELAPTIAATYPLEDAAIAHARSHGPGKVVLTVD